MRKNEDNLPMAQLLQRKFKTRNVPAIVLIRFNGNPCKWPDIMQNSKFCVYGKRTFSDSIRIERLMSMFDGEAKWLVTSVDQSKIFCEGALKILKHNFGNPVVDSL